MSYTAVLVDENGVDQGPLDISPALNDEQAAALARREAAKWLSESEQSHATVRVCRDGDGLPLIEVSM